MCDFSLKVLTSESELGSLPVLFAISLHGGDGDEVPHLPSGQEGKEKLEKSGCQPPFSLQLKIPSIQYLERCRLVRSGNKHFDEHCLPSTLHGEMRELVDMSRRDNFLVYLQCHKLCEYYGLPLTEDILMKGKGFGGWPLGGCQEGPGPGCRWHSPVVCPSPADIYPAKLL